MILIFCVTTYLLGATFIWRHIGYIARTKHSVCICYKNPCPLSGIFDYGWTLIGSLLFWHVIILGRIVQNVYGHYGPAQIGFFKPQPLLESVDSRQERKEKELKDREARIKRMEIEAGIVQPETYRSSYLFSRGGNEFTAR